MFLNHFNKVVFKFSSENYWLEDLPFNIEELLFKYLENKGLNRLKQNCFSSNLSLFSIPFKVRFYTEKGSNFSIQYRLELSYHYAIILFIFLLFAFFSHFEFGTYLWVGALVSFLFYILSLLIIKANLKKMIMYLMYPVRKIRTEADIQSWKKGSFSTCPVCESSLPIDDLFCPKCGLKVRQNAYKTA